MYAELAYDNNVQDAVSNSYNTDNRGLWNSIPAGMQNGLDLLHKILNFQWKKKWLGIENRKFWQNNTR